MTEVLAFIGVGAAVAGAVVLVMAILAPIVGYIAWMKNGSH